MKRLTICWPCLLVIAAATAFGVAGTALAQPAPAESSAAASDGVVEIEVGLLGTGDRRMERMAGATEWILGEIESFSAAHPNIRVTTLNVDDQRAVRPLVECPALPRNIVGICSESGYEVAYLVNRDEIVPVDQFLPDPDFDKSAFYDALWEPVTYEGQAWGVPWATTVAVLVCNWPMFEKAGIAEPPRTWEEFLNCARALTLDTNGDGVVDQVGCQALDRFTCEYLLGHVVVQKGLRIFTAAGFIPWSPGLEETFALVGELAAGTEQIASRAPEGSPYAMSVRFSRDAHPLTETADPSLRLAYLPTCGKDVSAGFDNLYLAVRKSTPEQEAAAWELVKWISRRDVALPKHLAGYPARKDFIEREDFQAAAQSWFRDTDILWRSGERLVDFGYCPMVGRYAALEEVADAASGKSGAEAEDAWNATARRINESNRILKLRPDKPYALFK